MSVLARAHPFRASCQDHDGFWCRPRIEELTGASILNTSAWFAISWVCRECSFLFWWKQVFYWGSQELSCLSCQTFVMPHTDKHFSRIVASSVDAIRDVYQVPPHRGKTTLKDWTKPSPADKWHVDGCGTSLSCLEVSQRAFEATFADLRRRKAFSLHFGIVMVHMLASWLKKGVICVVTVLEEWDQVIIILIFLEIENTSTQLFQEVSVSVPWTVCISFWIFRVLKAWKECEVEKLTSPRHARDWLLHTRNKKLSRTTSGGRGKWNPPKVFNACSSIFVCPRVGILCSQEVQRQALETYSYSWHWSRLVRRDWSRCSKTRRALSELFAVDNSTRQH